MKIKFTLLFLFFVTLFCSNLFSQGSLCKDPCPPGPIIYRTIPHCYLLDNNNNPVPSVFTIIAYRIRNCNGVSTTIIENFVVVDERDYYLNTLRFTIDNTRPCLLPSPLLESDLLALSAEAVSALVSLNGNAQLGPYDLYFKGACRSLVELEFPTGSFFTTGAPNDFGIIDTFYLSNQTYIYQSIPCHDICCKITWNYDIINMENGETQTIWYPISVEVDTSSCNSQSLPNYLLYDKKIEANMYNPISGVYEKVKGVPIKQYECRLSCGYYGIPLPGFLTSVETDISPDISNIELKASPIPFNNSIKLSTNKPIKEVNFYDMKGKIVLNIKNLNDGEINTNQLERGIYFIQVNFGGNIIKTIKVIKQ